MWSNGSSSSWYRSTTVARLISEILLVFILLRGINSATASAISQGDTTGRDLLFITVSSIKESNIEFNWKFTGEDPPTRLELFSNEPIQRSNAMVSLDVSHEKEGYYVTKTRFANYSLPGGWEKSSMSVQKPQRGKHCLNYWLAAYRNNYLVQKQCLSIQPTWMKDNGERIGDLPLTQMFIPGTHNSGCYDLNPDADVKIKALDKYLYNQDKDIWTQLVFGIRYLDVRIGYYNTSVTPDSFWVNHDVFLVSPLLDMLRDIKLFLSKAQDEIVVMDIHRFPVGFKNRKRHHQLVDLLQKEIGDIAIPRYFQKSPDGPTLNELWKQKKRLIICYADTTSAINSDILWDAISQKWGNQQSVEGLKSYIDNANSNHVSPNNNNLWAAMAELTPSTASVLLGILSSKRSLGHMADSVNRNLTAWYREEWCGVANIVATDFFLSNDIINVAIDCNLRKTNVSAEHYWR
ncbi:Phosphatidylinositol-specific phospholipase C X domain containing [Carabus blaptoides fortunei]